MCYEYAYGHWGVKRSAGRNLGVTSHDTTQWYSNSLVAPRFCFPVSCVAHAQVFLTEVLSYHNNNNVQKQKQKNKIEKDTRKGRNETIISIPDLHGFQLIAIFSIYYLSLAHVNLTTDQEPSHVNAHEAKPIPLFKKHSRSQDPIGSLKSLATLEASP